MKLFSFATIGYPEVVFLLINAGLDVKQKDSFGQVQYISVVLNVVFMTIYLQTPMHSCCIKGDLQVAEMLLEQV